MYRQYLIHALYFNNYFAICDNIHTIAAIKLYTLIFQWQWLLPFKRNILQLQFVTVAFFICGL